MYLYGVKIKRDAWNTIINALDIPKNKKIIMRNIHNDFVFIEYPIIEKISSIDGRKGRDIVITREKIHSAIYNKNALVTSIKSGKSSSYLLFYISDNIKGIYLSRLIDVILIDFHEFEEDNTNINLSIENTLRAMKENSKLYSNTNIITRMQEFIRRNKIIYETDKLIDDIIYRLKMLELDFFKKNDAMKKYIMMVGGRYNAEDFGIMTINLNNHEITVDEDNVPPLTDIDGFLDEYTEASDPMRGIATTSSNPRLYTDRFVWRDGENDV